MYRKLILSAALLAGNLLLAQDLSYTNKVLDTLTSPAMGGRGFVSDGHMKAANFISTEYEKAGLKKFGKTYFQAFDMSVNVFPSTMQVKFEGDVILKPDVDYMVAPEPPTLKGFFNLVLFDSTVVANKKKVDKMSQMDYENEFIVIDDSKVKDKDQKEFLHSMLSQPWNARGVIYLTDSKFTWSIAPAQATFMRIEMTHAAFKAATKRIYVDITSQVKKVKPQNVIGYVEGSQFPDSFVVISAHYDHLGKMGTATYFPGANDNASGTSMLLNFVQHYSKNPLKYSVVFMAFSAEEIGLVGSTFYTEHPLFPLKKIKFMVNMDIIGDAGDGITVVNGAIFTKEYDKLNEINDAKKYLPNIQKRGEAKNSDHYPFYAKGVKSIYIYGRGKSTAYHDVNDTKANLPLKNYTQCFELIRDFILTL